MPSSLKVDVRTFTGPSQHPDSFLFQTFSCRFAAMVGIIVTLHDPLLAKLQLTDKWLHIRLQNTFLYRGVHGQLNDCNVPRSCECKTSPNPYPFTALFDGWFEVFALICFVGFSPTWHCALQPEVLQLVQMQLCKAFRHREDAVSLLGCPLFCKIVALC